jgi:hypothetical protein
MQHDINHSEMTEQGYVDGLGSILLTTFAAVVSWQEQAEWAFRISSLLLACTVSLVVLYGHYKKSQSKRKSTK